MMNCGEYILLNMGLVDQWGFGARKKNNNAVVTHIYKESLV